MNGLIFQKTVVWKCANFAFWLTNVLKGLAMISGICIFTFSLYITTGSYHLLSLTGMALIACVIVLLIKDELSGVLDAFVWNYFKASALRKCVQGSFTDESGWMIMDRPDSPKSGMSGFLSNFKTIEQPKRVLKVIADDGESFAIGWDFRPLALSSDKSVQLIKGHRRHFVKHLFP